LSLTNEERENIKDLATAYAHFINISRKSAGLVDPFPFDDEAINTWANILVKHQEKTGIELCSPEKLAETIKLTEQLLMIKREVYDKDS